MRIYYYTDFFSSDNKPVGQQAEDDFLRNVCESSKDAILIGMKNFCKKYGRCSYLDDFDRITVKPAKNPYRKWSNTDYVIYADSSCVMLRMTSDSVWWQMGSRIPSTMENACVYAQFTLQAIYLMWKIDGCIYEVPLRFLTEQQKRAFQNSNCEYFEI